MLRWLERWQIYRPPRSDVATNCWPFFYGFVQSNGTVRTIFANAAKTIVGYSATALPDTSGRRSWIGPIARDILRAQYIDKMQSMEVMKKADSLNFVNKTSGEAGSRIQTILPVRRPRTSCYYFSCVLFPQSYTNDLYNCMAPVMGAMTVTHLEYSCEGAVLDIVVS